MRLFGGRMLSCLDKFNRLKKKVVMYLPHRTSDGKTAIREVTADEWLEARATACQPPAKIKTREVMPDFEEGCSIHYADDAALVTVRVRLKYDNERGQADSTPESMFASLAEYVRQYIIEAGGIEPGEGLLSKPLRHEVFENSGKRPMWWGNKAERPISDRSHAALLEIERRGFDMRAVDGTRGHGVGQ